MKAVINKLNVAVTTQNKDELAALARFVAYELNHTDYSKRDPSGLPAIKNIYVVKDYATYRFIKPIYYMLKQYLLNRHRIVIEETEGSSFTPDMVKIKLNKGWKPRDYQMPIIEYILKERMYPACLGSIQTGKGKTALTLFSIVKLQQRACIVLKADYIKQWVNVILDMTDIKEDEIYIFRGQKSMLRFLNAPKKERAQFKIFIMSVSTYNGYLKSYKLSPEIFEPHTPSKLFEQMDVGIIVIDEIHQYNFTYFEMMSYSGVDRLLGLSGSFVTNDKFLRKIFVLEFPLDNIYDELEWDRYINYIIIQYQLANTNGIRTSLRGSNTYSHIGYEQWLKSRPAIYKNYMDLISGIVNDMYISRKRKSDKCLIFVASIDFANALNDYLVDKYPDFLVGVFIEDDDLEKILTQDLTTSTPIKAGTAIDVPDLITVVNTVAIASPVANIQIPGRLRKIEGFHTRYIQLTCMSIPKHRQYQALNDELLDRKMLTTHRFLHRESI